MGLERAGHDRMTFTFTGHLGIQVFLIPEVPCLPWISPDIPWEWTSSGKSGWSSSASALIMQFWVPPSADTKHILTHPFRAPPAGPEHTPRTPLKPHAAPCKLHLQHPLKRERERERRERNKNKEQSYLHLLKRLKGCLPEPHESLLLSKRSEEHQGWWVYRLISF